MSTTHSEIGASSYDRWGKSLGGCPGSVRESRGVEKATSEFAEEGTKGHELAYSILNGQPYGDADEEMAAAVQVYVDYVNELADSTDNARVWRKLEQKFDLTKYYPGLFGTADCVLYFYATKRLIVVDYKHGAGVAVEPAENPQLMYYGLGAMHSLGLPVSSIELVIVQPRCHHHEGPIRSWKTDSWRLLDFVADLIDDAKATEDPKAELNPGDHCRWCPAKPKCPALRSKALALAEQTFSPLTTYDPAKLSSTLGMLSTMETWIKGVREFAYREAEQGRPPPGWKLVDKRANRKWRNDINEDHLARNLGLKNPEIYDTKLKSPAQIEKILCPAGLKVFYQFIVKESSGKTLVPDTDKRSSVKERAVTDFDSLT